MVNIELRNKMSQKFKEALVTYNRTGNTKVLNDAQVLMRETYKKEKMSDDLVTNLINEDIKSAIKRV